MSEELDILVKLLTDIFKRSLGYVGKLFARNQRIAARKRDFKDFRQIEPAVGCVCVILAHDERLLTACNGNVRKILLIYAVRTESLEKSVVVEH